MDENSIKKFFVTRIECRAISCDFSELQTNGCFVYHVKILVLLCLLTLVLHTECTPINRIRNLNCSKYQVLCFSSMLLVGVVGKTHVSNWYSRGGRNTDGIERSEKSTFRLFSFYHSFSFCVLRFVCLLFFAHFFFRVGGISGIAILVYGFMKLPMCLLSKPWMYYSVRVV